jgi:hypothetical protein
MQGLKPGTILSIMNFRFIVDSTDENGDSVIKQTGFDAPVKSNLKQQIREDIDAEIRKKEKKESKTKIIKTKAELEGEDNG